MSIAKKLPKATQKNQRFLMYGGVIIMGIVLLIVLQPPIQSIVPSGSIIVNSPTVGSTISKSSHIVVSVSISQSDDSSFWVMDLTTQIIASDGSWYSPYIPYEWDSDGVLISGGVTVPENGQYYLYLVIDLMENEIPYEEYRETFKYSFSVDYTSPVTTTTTTTTTTTIPMTDDVAPSGDSDYVSTETEESDIFDIPFPILPVFMAIIMIIVIKKYRK